MKRNLDVWNDASDYIGIIAITRLPYYNIKDKKIAYKARPVLIIGAELKTLPCDFTVLPLSSISDKSKISLEFDYEISSKDCRKYNLKNNLSFIRTHKPTTINSRDVHNKVICNLRLLDYQTYLIIEQKYHKFSKTLF
nr:type II toxin-antitoxin system PemK/MazF family toxin [Staphylococcus massiliensis]